MKGGISVCIVDDHPVLVAGLANWFTACDDVRVLGTGGTAQEAFSLCERLRPNVLIMDVRLPGDAILAAAQIVGRKLGTQVLFFTASDDPNVAITAMEAGALGYVLKGSSIEDLLQAIRTVHSGESYITPSFAARIVAEIRDAKTSTSKADALHLTVREDQVLALLKQGCTNREIGADLDISEKTVKHYVTVLMQKLNARNRTEVVLAALAIERNSPDPARHVGS